MDNLPAIQERLSANTVAATDAALESRISSLPSVSLSKGVNVIQHPKLGPTFMPRDVSLAGDAVELAALADAYRKGMTRPSPDRVEEWLAELSVIVARRPDDDITEALRLRAYTNRLCEYPADVVREALCKVTWKYWPCWEELKGVCDALSAPRRVTLAAIERAMNREPSAPRNVSPADMQARREAAQKIIADVFGGRQ